MSADVINMNYSQMENEYTPTKLLLEGISDSYKKAEDAAGHIFRQVSKASSDAAIAYQKNKKGVRYVLDLTDDALEKLETGKIKLTTENGGKTYAQYRQANGQYGSKVPVKRQAYGANVDPIQVANAMQLRAIQQQVEEMTEQVVALNQSVQDVLQGQQNDRIAQFFSGYSLYMEARLANNQQLRDMIVSQALKALSESTFQLMLELQTDIAYLSEGKYLESRKKRVELIDERMKRIDQSFAYIYQSSMMRAAIYCLEGELPSMAKVLDDYSHFIDNTIAMNSQLLIELDKNDDGTDRGIWKNRAKLKLDVSPILKQLSEPEKVIYLDEVKENAS